MVYPKDIKDKSTRQMIQYILCKLKDLLNRPLSEQLPYTLISVDVDTSELIATIKYNNITQYLNLEVIVSESFPGFYRLNLSNEFLGGKDQVLVYNTNYNGKAIQHISSDENGIVFASRDSTNFQMSFGGIFKFDIRVYN